MAITREEMQKTLNKDTKVLYKANNTEVMSFDDVNTAIMQDNIDNRVNISKPRLNSDGSIADLNVQYAGTNLQFYYNNRYKVEEINGKEKVYVIVDARAIDEQQTGRIYAKRIPVYVFGKKNKELKLEEITTVEDTDFVKYYTKKLNRDAMSRLLPMILETPSDIDEDEMPI